MSSNEGSSAIDQTNAIVPYAISGQITNSVCNFSETVQGLSGDEISINDIDNGACVIVDARLPIALSHTNLLDGNETSDSIIEPDITEVHVSTDPNVQSSSGTTSHFDTTPGARLIDVEERGHITSHVYATSSGTMLWMPEISDSSKPIKGTIYNTWSDAVKAYDLYAEKAGFSTRIGTKKKHPKTKVITHRYILCHRASTQSSRKLRYGMIFVPFTGVDHHKRCVTFGAALLCDETTESYVLLLETFLRAHKKQPLLVLTDQDSAMKGAIKRVFTESVHRLCMWHIMDKLPAKISAETDVTLDTTSIRASIHKLVWNLIIPPETFEEKWQELINTYNLRNHTWLTKMYDIRDEWIPSYFQDLPMCCLMKTTSRCESTNAMFKVNSSASNTLVQFLLCFDTAIDWQRYHQRDAEFASETTYYRFKTELPIERHAALLYTNNVFLEVQKEIDRSHNRVLPSFDGEVDGILKYTVAQYNAKR
ncbi:hypothetical protein SSX86_001002 [Deinandra increscens subsp. villosa]|uniref:MULE transposase domain-containing protein n=1 Tax=Deinandra increscens subsp. villosa TaxID=3103831 RepID=A0AAP0DQH0_9ASTR